MKTNLKPLPALLLGLFVVACSAPSNKEAVNETTDSTATETEAPAKKDVSKLTYREVVAMIFSEDGERIEWHGEEMPNTFAESISFSEDGNCGENDCGKALFITNNDESKTIEVIIKAAYDIEGDIGYMAWKHTLAPGATESMGCSHLCYNGKGYLFDRQVVGSVEVVDEAQE